MGLRQRTRKNEGTHSIDSKKVSLFILILKVSP